MGGGIGGLLQLRRGGSEYAYQYDGRGNVSSLLDSSEAVVASYRYDAFGKLLAMGGSFAQPFQFSTKRCDQGCGLSYYGYRFYAPAIGRWMNRDPLGEAGGINLYGFVSNNPVNFVDPLGLENWGQIGLGSLVAGGGALVMWSGGVISSTSWGHPWSFPEFSFGLGLIEIGYGIWLQGKEGVIEGWLEPDPCP